MKNQRFFRKLNDQCIDEMVHQAKYSILKLSPRFCTSGNFVDLFMVESRGEMSSQQRINLIYFLKITEI